MTTATESYVPMWKELGLDLEAHDSLLKVLGSYYVDVYFSQKDRPEGMKYLDFVMSEVHGLRIKELQQDKKTGKKIIGTYCVFVPEEMILALDGVSIGLCAGAEVGFAEAERYLPRSTCSLIKAFFGFTLARVCPYVESADLIIGETTCDGKKKAYDIFREIKSLYVMEIPHLKNSIDRDLWIAELHRLREQLEKTTGKKMEPGKLRESIELVNRKRDALNRIARLRAHSPAPISGKDALLISQVSFYDDITRFTRQINAIADELEERVKKGEGVFPKETPRLLISGCPMAVPNWKLPHLVETSGAVIVGEESCVGMRNIRNNVKAEGDTVEALIERIADRYLQIDCACFTPNDERLDHIVEMAKELKADGVIHYALSFCTPYMVESYRVEQALKKAAVPLLRIETDYSQQDAGQLKTRIQAFIEMITR
ncbi:MAG: double-cubane-cluster-containing anaerobic reductase [Candidatus Eremiobacteraeota bacterium]|nr:double-cubane-cluster-containing anaerobic reductase [Candidatus Eremiobacteraeota bacterium]